MHEDIMCEVEVSDTIEVTDPDTFGDINVTYAHYSGDDQYEEVICDDEEDLLIASIDDGNFSLEIHPKITH